MGQTTSHELAKAVLGDARPLTGAAADYDPLMQLIGDARFVLLGEASHGTHEFYRERARITERLIREKGFTVVAVEGDWPDAFRVNRFVRGKRGDAFAVEALAGFRRFPTWMWRNADVIKLLDSVRAHNDGLARGGTKAGFYGLDLYSLHASIDAVLRFLDTADPRAARAARERYACFDHFGDEAQAYGLMAGIGIAKSCEDDAVAQLVELQRRAAEYGERDDLDEEDVLNAEVNALVVRDAERYYRALFAHDVSTWNMRDRHMAETLAALDAHLERRGARPRIVVWAHNSHVGDARATEMGERHGELNVGQLVRERHDRDAVSVGFTTYRGTVTAASEWGAPAERKRVRPALPGSYEALFHDTELDAFLLSLRDPAEAVAEGLRAPRLERAIGVVYLPETERASHYFHARLADQFDVVVHVDETRAVEPLERTAGWERGELPETYPFGV